MKKTLLLLIVLSLFVVGVKGQIIGRSRNINDNKPSYDTLAKTLLITDGIGTSKSVKGYEVFRNNYDSFTLINNVASPIKEIIIYLNENKKPFPPSVIVWQSH